MFVWTDHVKYAAMLTTVLEVDLYCGPVNH